MASVIKCYSNLKLEGNDFAVILGEMNKRGWHSMVWQSKMQQLALAGIKTIDAQILKWISYNKINKDTAFIYRADIFLKDGDIFYLMQMNRYGFEYSTIEAGIITKTKNADYPILGPLIRAFIAALKSKIDGRRARHMKTNWFLYSENEKIDGNVFSKKFIFPVLEENNVRAAICLSDPHNKKVILQIAPLRPGQFKKKFTGGLPLQQLNALKGASLIQQSGVSEDYALTALGRTMLNGNHWMTTWITNLLIDKGIAEKSIIWNLSEDAEEVDIAVQFQGKVWIIELKDRDFESGDAHPFLYRSVKFKPDKTIIVTSGKVSKPAKKVFDDLYGKATYPLCIEGLEKVSDMFDKLITNTILESVTQKSLELAAAIHINLDPIITKIFGKYVLEYKGQYTKEREVSFLR